MNANTADRHVGPSASVGGRVVNPRRRKAIGVSLAVCAALALGSCGSSSSDSARPTTTTSTTRPKPTTTTTAPAPILDEQALAAASLTVADMPDGWKEKPPTTGGGTSGDGSPVSVKRCPAGEAIAKNDQHATYSVEFTESELGPNLSQDMGSAADADEHYADMKNSFDTCVGKSWPQDMDGIKVTSTLTSEPKVSVDGESSAYKLSISADDNSRTMEIDIVLVRNRSVVAQYTGVSLTMVNEDDVLYFLDALTRDELELIVGRGNARITTALDNA